MSHRWKLMLAGAGLLAFTTVPALAQTATDTDEDASEVAEPEPAGPGGAVSEAAQALGELDPDAVEGPGVSEEAKKLRAIAQENLPDAALEHRSDRAQQGRPENPGRPDAVASIDRPDRPDRPDKPDRPDRPDRPDAPDRPGI